MWALYGYVIRGKNRRKVFLSLATPKTPTQLAKSLKIHLPHISRALSELESKKLVTCLTPAERVGRIYALTDKGRRLFKMLRELEAGATHA
jgi:DNA-binding MarR family transcriptional regulator